MSSISLAVNAQVQYQSMQMGNPKYLSYEEGRAATEIQFSEMVINRVWEYWKKRSG